MSRNNKMRRQEKIRQEVKLMKKRREQRLARVAQIPKWPLVVATAEKLIARGDWQEARTTLEQFDRSQPGETKVLRLLLDIYNFQRDYDPYCRCCRRLVEQNPSDRPLRLMLAAGSMNAMRAASALAGFQQFVELWPDDPMTESARQTIAALEAKLGEDYRDFPFPRERWGEFGTLHEEVMAGAISDEKTYPIACGERLLTLCPEFLPVRNNLAALYFQTGRFADALAMSRQVLQRDAENFHALGNLARHLFVLGEREEARQICERLQNVRSAKLDYWPKRAETLSVFGDDEGVLDAFEQGRRAGMLKIVAPGIALVYHLAAAAEGRLGNHDRAQRYWRAALKIMPRLEWAQQNLDDSQRPASHRNGPWFSGLPDLISGPAFNDFCDLITTTGKDEAAVQQALGPFLESHPEVATLVPDLLDRGDERGRWLALQIAKFRRTPEMLETLRQFCLSRRGPDKVRSDAAMFLRKNGTLPAGQIRMWIDGRWSDTEVIGFEITWDVIYTSHNEQVADWCGDGQAALERRDGVRAEQLFRRCIEVEGEKPDLLNNLGVAYSVQGREEEAVRLAREVHARWPGYFFGRIAMANLAIRERDYARAEQYLAPLRQSDRLHITEFTALATAQIQLFLVQRNFDEAEGWLQMWRDTDPDHPTLEAMEMRYASARPLASRFKRIVFW